jgi:hypothetical protein
MHTTQQHKLTEPRTLVLVPFMAIVFAAGTLLGAVADIDLPSGGAVSIPAGDRSYDALEETRADRGLSIPAGDRSYDALEETRADRVLSIPAGDRSYDALEETRADRGID